MATKIFTALIIMVISCMSCQNKILSAKEQSFIKYFKNNKLEVKFKDKEFSVRGKILFIKKFVAYDQPPLALKIKVPVVNNLTKIEWDRKEVFTDSGINTNNNINELITFAEIAIEIARKYKIREMENRFPDNSIRFQSVKNRYLVFLKNESIPKSTLNDTHILNRIDPQWIIYTPKSE